MGKDGESENRITPAAESEVEIAGGDDDDDEAALTKPPAPPVRKLLVTSALVTFVVSDPTGAPLEGHVALAALKLPPSAKVVSSGRLFLASYKFEVAMPYEEHLT